MAEKLDKVAKACRLTKYSRSQFYEIKRRYELKGFQGLIDRLLIHKSSPNRKGKELVEKLLEVTRDQPVWEQARMLLRFGWKVIMYVRTPQGISGKTKFTPHQLRWLRIEQESRTLDLTEDQINDWKTVSLFERAAR